MREAFDDGLRTSAADKIFDTLPDHVFYDIKKPLDKENESFWNEYNPARRHAHSSFFDMRRHEDYFINQNKKQDNIKNNVSYYRKY
jgi:hypothetical protein